MLSDTYHGHERGLCQGRGREFAESPDQLDRFNVIALANSSMDVVRREEMRTQPKVVRAALGEGSKAVKAMMWAMRKNPVS
jgi:hypothetical protein